MFQSEKSKFKMEMMKGVNVKKQPPMINTAMSSTMPPSRSEMVRNSQQSSGKDSSEPLSDDWDNSNPDNNQYDFE